MHTLIKSLKHSDLKKNEIITTFNKIIIKREILKYE